MASTIPAPMRRRAKSSDAIPPQSLVPAAGSFDSGTTGSTATMGKGGMQQVQQQHPRSSSLTNKRRIRGLFRKKKGSAANTNTVATATPPRPPPSPVPTAATSTTTSSILGGRPIIDIITAMDAPYSDDDDDEDNDDIAVIEATPLPPPSPRAVSVSPLPRSSTDPTNTSTTTTKSSPLSASRPPSMAARLRPKPQSPSPTRSVSPPALRRVSTVVPPAVDTTHSSGSTEESSDGDISYLLEGVDDDDADSGMYGTTSSVVESMMNALERNKSLGKIVKVLDSAVPSREDLQELSSLEGNPESEHSGKEEGGRGHSNINDDDESSYSSRSHTSRTSSTYSDDDKEEQDQEKLFRKNSWMARDPSPTTPRSSSAGSFHSNPSTAVTDVIANIVKNYSPPQTPTPTQQQNQRRQQLPPHPSSLSSTWSNSPSMNRHITFEAAPPHLRTNTPSPTMSNARKGMLTLVPSRRTPPRVLAARRKKSRKEKAAKKKKSSKPTSALPTRRRAAKEAPASPLASSSSSVYSNDDDSDDDDSLLGMDDEEEGASVASSAASALAAWIPTSFPTFGGTSKTPSPVVVNDDDDIEDDELSVRQEMAGQAMQAAAESQRAFSPTPPPQPEPISPWSNPRNSTPSPVRGTTTTEPTHGDGQPDSPGGDSRRAARLLKAKTSLFRRSSSSKQKAAQNEQQQISEQYDQDIQRIMQRAASRGGVASDEEEFSMSSNSQRSWDSRGGGRDLIGALMDFLDPPPSAQIGASFSFGSDGLQGSPSRSAEPAVTKNEIGTQTETAKPATKCGGIASFDDLFEYLGVCENSNNADLNDSTSPSESAADPTNNDTGNSTRSNRSSALESCASDELCLPINAEMGMNDSNNGGGSILSTDVVDQHGVDPGTVEPLLDSSFAQELWKSVLAVHERQTSFPCSANFDADADEVEVTPAGASSPTADPGAKKSKSIKAPASASTEESGVYEPPFADDDVSSMQESIISDTFLEQTSLVLDHLKQKFPDLYDRLSDKIGEGKTPEVLAALASAKSKKESSTSRDADTTGISILDTIAKSSPQNSSKKAPQQPKFPTPSSSKRKGGSKSKRRSMWGPIRNAMSLPGTFRRSEKSKAKATPVVEEKEQTNEDTAGALRRRQTEIVVETQDDIVPTPTPPKKKNWKSEIVFPDDQVDGTLVMGYSHGIAASPQASDTAAAFEGSLATSPPPSTTRSILSERPSTPVPMVPTKSLADDVDDDEDDEDEEDDVRPGTPELTSDSESFPAADAFSSPVQFPTLPSDGTDFFADFDKMATNNSLEWEDFTDSAFSKKSPAPVKKTPAATKSSVLLRRLKSSVGRRGRRSFNNIESKNRSKASSLPGSPASLPRTNSSPVQPVPKHLDADSDHSPTGVTTLGHTSSSPPANVGQMYGEGSFDFALFDTGPRTTN